MEIYDVRRARDGSVRYHAWAHGIATIRYCTKHAQARKNQIPHQASARAQRTFTARVARLLPAMRLQLPTYTPAHNACSVLTTPARLRHPLPADENIHASSSASHLRL